MTECPDCLLVSCRCDPPDALVIHDAAGPCWPRYHRGMPDGSRCRCGLLTAPARTPSAENAELTAAAVGADLKWFVEGMAAKFGVSPAKIEVTLTVYDDDKGEQVTVGWKQ